MVTAKQIWSSYTRSKGLTAAIRMDSILQYSWAAGGVFVMQRTPQSLENLTELLSWYRLLAVESILIRPGIDLMIRRAAPQKRERRTMSLPTAD